MDNDAQQLVRLAELITISAGAIRDVVRERSVGSDTNELNYVAYELERLSEDVRRIGFFPAST